MTKMAASFCRCVQRYVSSGQPVLAGSGQAYLAAGGQLASRVPRMFRLQVTCYSTEPKSDVETTDKTDVKVERSKEKKMSSAMKMYMTRKRNYDTFIAREEAEFEMGRQHLANMMGMDVHHMTQEDIDKSIEYLFPSGLIPEARPVMKPPQEIFPRQKEAEFNSEGRPYHSFFYTLKPSLTLSNYKIREAMQAVFIFGERLAKQGKTPDRDQVLDVGKLADSRWVTREELGSICMEDVTEEEHAEFITSLERLVELPFSYRAKDVIFLYRVHEDSAQSEVSFVEPRYDERGRAVVEHEGRRKTATAHVKLTKPGSGQFTLKHADHPEYITDIGYFFAIKDRLQIIYPLQFTKMLGLVDTEVTVQGSGPSAQAGAVRYALSMCLRSFVDKETADDMKINGLLTQDIRVRERKKFGKVKARKAYTWKRR